MRTIRGLSPVPVSPPPPPPLSYFMETETLQIITSFLWKASPSFCDFVHLLLFVLHTFFSYQLMMLIGFCFNILVSDSTLCPVRISFFVFVQETVSVHKMVLQTSFFHYHADILALYCSVSILSLCFITQLKDPFWWVFKKVIGTACPKNECSRNLQDFQ